MRAVGRGSACWLRDLAGTWGRPGNPNFRWLSHCDIPPWYWPAHLPDL